MRSLAYQNDRYNCIFLSRNYGHQLALTAGLSVARGTDAIMIIDGDLQDPPELLIDFYTKLKEGADVVYAIRRKRKETWLKRTLYSSFYQLLKRISYIDIPPDSGDFCMMSRRVLDVLNKMPEESRFIRGMRSWIGFNQVGLEYERDARAAGEAKYDFKMLFRLAFNGIFNFSEFPIKLITQMGGYSMLLALTYLTWVLVKRFILGIEVIEGFTALLFTIILFSSVQLLSIGILGEYILRIFFQVKQRPLFIIKEQIVNTTNLVK
jgi:polyisoprenyl-phosphate glycosyltransferase